MRTVTGLLLVAALAFTAFAAGPRLSPPFTIDRTDGPPLQVKSFHGKVVALVFISTSCPHCQDFTRQLASLAKEYGPKGVEFLECAINPTAKADVPGFIQAFQPPFPVGYSTQGAVDTYLERSVVETFYVPHAVFLDRNGMIQGDFAGESDFMKNPGPNTRATLDRLLHAPSAPKTAATSKKAATK
jgi:thiol-disulfide isomerase/thioredoxin